MNNKNNNNFNEEKENNFTMLRKNDTIKSKDSFLSNTLLKDTQNMLNRTKEIGKEKSNAIKPSAQSNTAPVNTFIPKEKKEQERLRRATGSYDLKKSDPNEINKHLKLTQKTPDDYYSLSVPYKELNKRLDNEAFGPKTDFSIWNYENNYDKMNNEEQSMFTYKMQREFNKLGYTDTNGYKLKTDGILGDKTNSVLEQYKKDNKDELEDFEQNNKKIVEGEDYQVLKNEDGKPILLASTDMTPEAKLVSNTDYKITDNPYGAKKLQIKPIESENKDSKTQSKNIDEISKYSTTVQVELLKLKVAWYMAQTQEEKDAIHEEANRIRELADNGWGKVLDTAKSITGAAADEFSWFLGGDVSRAERDFWLSQLQKFDPTIEIQEKEALNALMFIAGILAPSPDDAWKMISKKASKDMLKTMGEKGIRKFYNAMTKYVNGKQNSDGVKYLGKSGMKYKGKIYHYEVKITGGQGAGYRLLGNIDENGDLFFTTFDNPH